MRLYARPHQLDLTTPGRRDYHVALRHDSLAGEHLIPLTVFVGPEAKAGKGLVAIGGNHGDEYEGPMALKWLLHEIEPNAVLGRLIIIPVLNPSAFGNDTREAETADGLNLNRLFHPPGKPAAAGDTVSHRIVEFLRRHIWENVHLVFDVHTGGAYTQFVNAALFHRGANLEATLAAARRFRPRALLTMTNINQSTLTTDATRHGHIAVGFELGYGTTVSAAALTKVKHGVLANAVEHRLLVPGFPLPSADAPDTPVQARIVDPDSFLAAPFAGYYEPHAAVGDLVEKGQVLGWLHDFNRIDMAPEPIKAHIAGLLVIQPNITVVPQGCHLAAIGVPDGES
ncbi:MAG: succinylglutamate desuccinylase/aspartoacylase family protein [Proteobacteria bacterium]|nr:succinylglutamate desuccinylase/aspartoacylase family protein [Pseudomonadota bacterium]